MLSEKVIIIKLIVGLIKKDIIQMSEYFPKLHKNFGGKVKAQLI